MYSSSESVVIAVLEQLRPVAVRIIVSNCEYRIAPVQWDCPASRTGPWCIQAGETSLLQSPLLASPSPDVVKRVAEQLRM